MSAEILTRMDVSGRDIAVQSLPGANPGLFWLGGFKSDSQVGVAGPLTSAVDDFLTSLGLPT